MLRALGRGFAIGLAWGVLARVFMRLLATNPEFTWPGTLGIVGLSAVLWAGIGLVAEARRRARSRWWRLAPLPGLVLFASPGMLLLPGALGVAAAASVRNRLARIGLAALGLAGTLVPVLGLDGEERGALTPTAWLGIGLLVVATAWLGLGFRAWWRRWQPAPVGEGSTVAEGPRAYGLA